MSKFHSSGELAADRRYLWAEGSRAEGDWDAAAELFAQAVELAPSWPSGWYALGDALERLGRGDEARQAFDQCRALDAADTLGAGLRLARLGGEPVASMPARFVAGLFDGYASGFDRHLVDKLAYRGPEIIVSALQTVMQRDSRAVHFARVLDLGCGTGLLAEALQGKAGEIDGVDLSPGMLEVARAKNLYHALHIADVTAFVAAVPPAAGYDLIAAADVLVYLGDLAPLFQAVPPALSPSGLFAFTVQSRPDAGFALGADMRFHHAETYLRTTAAAAGLACRHLAPVVTRRDGGQDVPGFVVVLEASRP